VQANVALMIFFGFLIPEGFFPQITRKRAPAQYLFSRLSRPGPWRIERHWSCRI